MIEPIRTKLNELLSTLVGTDKPLVALYDYHTFESPWYPYASFEPTAYSGEILDTCNNMRPITFDLYIYQEIIKNGRSTALDILVKSNDKVINLLDKNFTLDWLVQGGVVPIQWDFWQIVWSNWKTLFVNIKIVCNTIDFIHSV